MRIAVVHSFYRSDSPSGENTVVRSEVEALRQRGHDVLLVSRSSDDIDAGPVAQAAMGWRVATGRGFDPTADLGRFTPDVTHVHNLFPNFALDWLDRWQGPLVATVHNYRSVCANAVLFRDGHPCTLCPDGHRWAGVRHRCYRDSALASLPIAWRNRRGPQHDALLARADRTVVLSDRARKMLIGAGAPAERMRLVPNGVAAPGRTPRRPDGNGRWLSVGRLTPEKGVAELLRMWPPDAPLDVVGSGPLADDLARRAPACVRFVGAVPHGQLIAELPAYRGLVFPGLAAEGAYPLVVVEAWAAGLPVIARAGGAGAEMVHRWGGGAVYADAGELAGLLNRPFPAGDPRAIYEQEFTVERWLDRLEDVFVDAGRAGLRRFR